MSKHLDKIYTCGHCRYIESMGYEKTDIKVKTDISDTYWCSKKENEGYQVKLWQSCKYFAFSPTSKRYLNKLNKQATVRDNNKKED